MLCFEKLCYIIGVRAYDTDIIIVYTKMEEVEYIQKDEKHLTV